MEGLFLNHSKQTSEGAARGSGDDTSQVMIFLAGVLLLHARSLIQIEFSQVVTSSPQVGWSPVLVMVMRSLFLKGVSENMRTGGYQMTQWLFLQW